MTTKQRHGQQFEGVALALATHRRRLERIERKAREIRRQVERRAARERKAIAREAFA